MIVNPEKVQPIAVKRNFNMAEQFTCVTDSNGFTADKSVKLLGIYITHKFSFDGHIYSLYKKGTNHQMSSADFRDT